MAMNPLLRDELAELIRQSAPLPVESMTAQSRELLNDASAELAQVRGMLMVLAQYDEGEIADAIWGVVSLVEHAKTKVDSAFPGVSS